MRTFQEQRKNKRFRVKNRSTVLLSPTTTLSYSVLDISDSGLSFNYTGWEKWPARGLKLDILDREFFLENISVSVIKDVQVDYGTKQLRRCGVKFTKLGKSQKAKLGKYISSVAAD